MTLRELWAMARGRADADAENRAWWLAQFGKKLNAGQVHDMNPFRVAEKPPPTPEQKEDEVKRAWDVVDAFFSQYGA
jgi:hypothetical protein